MSCGEGARLVKTVEKQSKYIKLKLVISAAISSRSVTDKRLPKKLEYYVRLITL